MAGIRRSRRAHRPRPAAVLLSLLAVAMLAVTAFSLGGCFPRTTPGPSPTVAAPFALPTLVSATAAARETTKTPAPASVPPTETPKPPAVLVAGAGANAPIQQLYAIDQSLPKRELLDISNPASVLVLVNKHQALVPRDYMPADLVNPGVPLGSGEPASLRKVAAVALEHMFAGAAANGVNMTIMSSFRSYATQVSLYNSYVAQKGVAGADTSSARPGFSEHQTGLAVDIGDASVPASCQFTWCMASSPAGLWVSAHAAEYGFIVRYQLDLEAVTGYLAEPWHLRFVGEDVARDMDRRGILTYEKYLGMSGAPDYLQEILTRNRHAQN